MIQKFILFLAFPLFAFAGPHSGEHMPMHQMQHGFVLADNDDFASHLVANGHHSRQVEVMVDLKIEDPAEQEFYQQRRSLNADRKAYFLFQAQQLDLPSLKDGQVLSGHIVESRMGQYDSKNIIVKRAELRVQKILLNFENPFFVEEAR